MGVWNMILDKDRRERLAFVGGAAAALIGAVWVLYTHFAEPTPAPTVNVITLRLLEGASRPPGPDPSAALKQVVVIVATGAKAGNDKLQRVLTLLQNGQAAEAAQMLRALADEQADLGQADPKEVAATYRGAGTLAGLKDPDRAVRYFNDAIKADPADAESRVWAGWIELRRANLAPAEALLRGVPAPPLGTPATFEVAWAAVGLADIAFQRGDLAAATREYRMAGLMVEQAAAADRDQARWKPLTEMVQQRALQQLAWAADRAFAEKRPDQAAKGLSLVVDGRLTLLRTQGDNAELQHDLALAYDHLARAQHETGSTTAELESLRSEQVWLQRLTLRFPGNEQLRDELTRASAQIASRSAPPDTAQPQAAP